MKNTAVIHKIENNKIFLMHIKDYNKKDNTERSFWNIKETDFQADNPDKLTLKEGDFVEYSIPPGKTIFSTFMLLIMPLLLFFTGYLLASRLGAETEAAKGITGIIFLTGGFIINTLIKRFGKGETLPTILKKVNKSSQKNAKCSSCGSCTVCE